MNIGIIGTGRIARRLVEALAHGDNEARSIVISQRNESISAELVERYAHVSRTADAQEIVDASDVVFLCLPGEAALDILRPLRFRADQAVISTMLGVTVADIADTAAPAAEVCVTIPLPFVAEGGCPLPVHPDGHALRRLMGDTNPVIPVASEEAMTAFWAVAGTLASVLTEVSTARDWLASRTGDPVGAERYVLALFGGFLSTRPLDGHRRLDEALADLATPGGMNASMQAALREQGHFKDFAAQMTRLHSRLAPDAAARPAGDPDAPDT